MHVHPLPPNQEKSFAQKCPKEEIKFRPEISAKQNVYIPLRYDKTNTKVLEINKQVILASIFVFIVYRTVNLTSLNEWNRSERFLKIII